VEPIFCWRRSWPSTVPATVSVMGPAITNMTIARLRARKPVTAVGIAFAIQEVPTVPATPRDERLDLVLTENEVVEIKAG